MPNWFTSFVLLAEMRTGSNFLEENINQIAGLRCWGEAFNSHFVGNAGKTEMAGVDLATREADPTTLLAALAERTEGLPGFRFFHDHDPRIAELCLADPHCAKIVLTRNPLDSFISLQIARATNQWRLGDMKSAKRARVRFDPEAFARHLHATQEFQLRVLRTLQTTGQTAFYIPYEDAGDIEVLNGLAAWLGVAGRLDKLEQTTKVQNPADLREKVENYDEMVEALGGIDHFGLGRTPNFEPRRGPAVPSFVLAAKAPMMFLPIPGGPEDVVIEWLAALDGVGPEALGRDGSQKDVRKWKRQHPGHRSFTVLSHPVERLHRVFCRHILMPGADCLSDLRATLRHHYKLPLPEGAPDAAYDAATHRAAFLAFAGYIGGNLAGQTSQKVEPLWATQSAVLQGMAQFMLPDMILREDEMATGLASLATALGREAPGLAPPADPSPIPLASIYDAEVEAAVRSAYQRDYMMFGFTAWA